MKKAEKYRKIIEKAEEMFATKQYHEITVDEIALNAGVGKGTIYRYFENKENLYYKTALEGIEEFRLLVESFKSPGKNIAVDLKKRALKICQFFEKRERLIRIIIIQLNNGSTYSQQLKTDWIDLHSHMNKTIAAIIERGKKQGLIKSKLSDSVLAKYYLTLVRNVGRIGPQAKETGVDLDSIINFFLHGACGP